MWHRKGIYRLIIPGLMIAVLALLSACTAQSEIESVRQQLVAQEQKATALEQQIAAREAELVELRETQATAGDVSEQVVALEQEVAELQTQLGELAGMTVILGAQALPTPEPRPAPTPLPEGAEPPPAPEPPAEYYEPVGDFAFYVETLTASGVTPDGYGYTAGCALNNTFMRGTKIVWRAEIIDLSTGMRLMPADDLVAKIVLPHGEERSMRFSQRGGGRVPDAPWMWAAAWEIPLDYPVGTLDFSLVVTTPDERTGIFRMPYSGVQVEIIDLQYADAVAGGD
jgi:hypothetical protein